MYAATFDAFEVLYSGEIFFEFRTTFNLDPSPVVQELLISIAPPNNILPLKFKVATGLQNK